MADDGPDLEFLSPASFEWDDRKCELNLAKHGIDFDSAIEVFYGPIILRRSDRNNEERWTALGYSGNRLIVVVHTRRLEVIRIISARRARKHEKREYRNAKVG
ncbi:MAG: BrnT family toxin [Alphaproteobacteria bacterium]|nr:MAG: BrnT family toxin [Alphaproteobacteria bacterium]